MGMQSLIFISKYVSFLLYIEHIPQYILNAQPLSPFELYYVVLAKGHCAAYTFVYCKCYSRKENIAWNSREALLIHKSSKLVNPFLFEVFVYANAATIPCTKIRKIAQGWGICRTARISFLLVSYQILSYPILSYRIVSYRITSHHIISYIICYIICYIMSYLMICHTTPHHVTPHHITSHHTTPPHPTSHHTTSYRCLFHY